MTEANEINRLAASRRRVEEVTLSASESQRLIGICIELIGLCSKVTGKFDPSMGTMIAFARDEALTDAVGMKL
jgi:hypothetical protein